MYIWLKIIKVRACSRWAKFSYSPTSFLIIASFSHFSLFFFLNKFIYFIYLFLAVLGLCCCARALPSRGERGPPLVAVRRPLTAAVGSPPPAAEHRLQTRRLSSCGSWAQPLRGMWDLPRPGLEPVSPALACGFSTTAPPGKPSHFSLQKQPRS